MDKLILKIEVESDFVDSRSGVSAKSGKPYDIHTQKAWVYLNSKFPKEIQLSLDDPKHKIAPGLYEADLLPALDVGDFGKLTIDLRKLVLLTPAAKPSAARAA